MEKVDELKAAGHAVQLGSHAIDAADGLYIDSIYIPATEEQTNESQISYKIRVENVGESYGRT